MVTYEFLTNAEFREHHISKGTWKYLFNRDYYAPLHEDAILQYELHVPSEENATSLARIDAPAGRFAAYDFHRRKEFKRRQRGRLTIFPIKEVAGNPPSRRTPDHMFNLYNWNHLSTIRYPTLEEAVNKGFLYETTYAAAFTQAGAEQYQTALDVLGIAGKTVYQVTPKGNGLVDILNDHGDTKPKEDHATVPEHLAPRPVGAPS